MTDTNNDFNCGYNQYPDPFGYSSQSEEYQKGWSTAHYDFEERCSNGDT